MSTTCPLGHRSAAEDCCDVCGTALADGATVGLPAPAAAAPTGAAVLAPSDAPMAARACPHCSAPNLAEAEFCEVCGHELTVGHGFTWVVELETDPRWYAAQESPDPLPTSGPPVVRPLHGRSLLIGRTSPHRDVRPDVDCLGDSGVSRRQSRLTTDGTRWWVEDLDSANGTFVGRVDTELPSEPVPVGVRRELWPDERIWVGAWTRLRIRAATDDERATLA